MCLKEANYVSFLNEKLIFDVRSLVLSIGPIVEVTQCVAWTESEHMLNDENPKVTTKPSPFSVWRSQLKQNILLT